MKAKDIPCKQCDGDPKLYGSDDNDCEGPWNIACANCGNGTDLWAYPREAWKQWKFINN